MDNIQLCLGDCLEVMKNIEDESIQLLVTSPPYFNAREYSQYETLEEYKEIMSNIFREVYRVMENHRYIVVNVGDIISQVGKKKYQTRKLALGAWFTLMLQDLGFIYIDDYIWDKGEPQSKRNVGNPPYPYYQYPVNCYEHILIFAKHKVDKTRIKCPICNSDNVVSNGYVGIGVYGFECKNPQCPTKSKKGRGKRFSSLTIMRDGYKTEENKIDEKTLKNFRRDISKITPVIKINNKGENKIGHTAPFPKEIPEFAIKFFSGTKDLVMDCFMGSGTTGVACKNLNRKFIGIEKEEDYYNIAKQRIEEEK